MIYRIRDEAEDMGEHIGVGGEALGFVRLLSRKTGTSQMTGHFSSQSALDPSRCRLLASNATLCNSSRMLHESMHKA